MGKEIKYMDIKEFQQMGLLAEVNRSFFHPLGLALEVAVDESTGDMRLNGIWDDRDDPEGTTFGGDKWREACLRAREWMREKHKIRRKILGYVQQPIKGQS